MPSVFLSDFFGVVLFCLPRPGFIIPCPFSEPDNCFALFYFVINACVSHVIIMLMRYFLIPKSRDLGIGKRSVIPGLQPLKA